MASGMITNNFYSKTLDVTIGGSGTGLFEYSQDMPISADITDYHGNSTNFCYIDIFCYGTGNGRQVYVRISDWRNRETVPSESAVFTINMVYYHS